MIKTAHKNIFRGFTLIELLIVVAILGILAAAVLVAINPAKRTKQARDAARKSDIGGLVTELQAYYTTPGQGVYPTLGGSGCGTANNALTVLTTTGLKVIPSDPKSTSDGWKYCYNVNGTGVESSVYATIEDPSTGSGTAYWCWQSSTGKVQEFGAVASCAP